MNHNSNGNDSQNTAPNQNKNQGDEQSSLLTFPTQFPIKVMGDNTDAFSDSVKHIITSHTNESDLLDWRTQASRSGNFLSITATIMAQSQQQLDAIYIDLSASELVKMAL